MRVIADAHEAITFPRFLVRSWGKRAEAPSDVKQGQSQAHDLRLEDEVRRDGCKRGAGSEAVAG
jgi:hypothetical protein